MTYLGYTKILVVGGFDLGETNGISRVEVLNLEDTLTICEQTSPLHKGNYLMTLGVFSDQVKSCGGGARSHKCYNYHPDENKWLRSKDMAYGRYRHAASFIYGYWLITGSAGEPDGSIKKTERWNGTDYEECPPLLRGMQDHCQLTVDEKTIFLASGDRQPNYLLRIEDELWRWTILPPTANDFGQRPSCGLIDTRNSGREVVLAGQSLCEIFSLRRQTWRSGPDTPYFYGAAATQVSDTFIVVGGKNISGHFLDTVYKFENINYGWTKMEQKIQVSASGLAVVGVPDDFVSCKLRFPDLAFNSK